MPDPRMSSHAWAEWLLLTSQSPRGRGIFKMIIKIERFRFAFFGERFRDSTS